MRVLVMGSGGVGGYFGGMLTRGGCEVNFVARGAHLEVMKTAGLTIETPEENIRISKVLANEEPTAFDVPDVVLLCVKLWDTQSAVRAIKPIVGPNTIVLSLQNGVQKDELIGEIIGSHAVVGGVCYIASRVSGPGVIHRTGPLQRMVFGEYEGEPRAKVRAFLDVCKQSGIDAHISLAIRRVIWEKFVFLVGLSASTATTRSSVGHVRENLVTRAFMYELMNEVVAVARALGVDLDPMYAADRISFTDTMAYDLKSSMLIDLERGKRLELPWLSGHIVELGKATGIPTPFNQAASAVLALQTDGTT